ncbi:MTH865 family protein [Haloarchaeobius sp. TZWWS8]|uniref:MTH865 family protein n=1 Tax=Haloarchaeobius sp. TZWWS8 TaxID=3446121 RepID=UPI003EBC99F8
MDTAEREVREQLHAMLAPATYPVADPFELVPTLPDGPTTRVTVGSARYTAMELAVRLASHQSFPYESVDELVDDVIAAMRKEELL